MPALNRYPLSLNSLARALGLAALLALSACANVESARPIPLATVGSESFATALAAVQAAAERYNPPSIAADREFMGAVLHDGQAYYYSVAGGRAGEDSVTLRLQVPAGMRIVAFWHTHGGSHYTREYFSAVDSHLVQSTGLPFYMADYRGALRVLEPSHPTLSALQAQRLGLGRNSGYAEGERVRDAFGNAVRVPTVALALTGGNT